MASKIFSIWKGFLYKNMLSNIFSIRKFLILHIFYTKMCYTTHFQYKNILSKSVYISKCVIQQGFYTKNCFSANFPYENIFKHIFNEKFLSKTCSIRESVIKKKINKKEYYPKHVLHKKVLSNALFIETNHT